MNELWWRAAVLGTHQFELQGNIHTTTEEGRFGDGKCHEHSTGVSPQTLDPPRAAISVRRITRTGRSTGLIAKAGGMELRKKKKLEDGACGACQFL